MFPLLIMLLWEIHIWILKYVCLYSFLDRNFHIKIDEAVLYFWKYHVLNLAIHCHIGLLWFCSCILLLLSRFSVCCFLEGREGGVYISRNSLDLRIWNGNDWGNFVQNPCLRSFPWIKSPNMFHGMGWLGTSKVETFRWCVLTGKVLTFEVLIQRGVLPENTS